MNFTYSHVKFIIALYIPDFSPIELQTEYTVI